MTTVTTKIFQRNVKQGLESKHYTSRQVTCIILTPYVQVAEGVYLSHDTNFALKFQLLVFLKYI